MDRLRVEDAEIPAAVCGCNDGQLLDVQFVRPLNRVG